MNDKGKFIARGIFNGRSRIRVRLYTWDAAQALDDARAELETLRQTLSQREDAMAEAAESLQPVTVPGLSSGRSKTRFATRPAR